MLSYLHLARRIALQRCFLAAGRDIPGWADESAGEGAPSAAWQSVAVELAGRVREHLGSEGDRLPPLGWRLVLWINPRASDARKREATSQLRTAAWPCDALGAPAPDRLWEEVCYLAEGSLNEGNLELLRQWRDASPQLEIDARSDERLPVEWYLFQLEAIEGEGESGKTGNPALQLPVDLSGDGRRESPPPSSPPVLPVLPPARLPGRSTHGPVGAWLDGRRAARSLEPGRLLLLGSAPSCDLRIRAAGPSVAGILRLRDNRVECTFFFPEALGAGSQEIVSEAVPCTLSLSGYVGTYELRIDEG